MSSFKRKTGNMPPFEDLNYSSKRTYNNEFSENLLENAHSVSKKIKQELIVSSHTSELPSSVPSLSQLCPSDSSITSAKIQKAKSKGRVQSKAGPKSRKKNQAKCSLNVSNEEQNLDKDLLGLVGTINTNKNLDSDSSDTIILDDSSSNSPHKDVQNNSNEKRSVFNQSTTFDFPFSIKNEENKFSNMGMWGNTNNMQSSVAVQSSKRQTIKNVQPSVLSNKKVKEEERFSESNCSFSVLKEALTKFPSKVSSLPTSSKQALSNFEFTGNNSGLQSKGTSDNKIKKRQKKKYCNNVSVAVINSLNQKSNFQSVYASMGLDEDLCDVDQNLSKKTFSITSKEPCRPLRENKNLYDVPIKVEPEDTFFNACNDNEKNKPFIDFKSGNHVCMTFEAESPCEEEDEDDLPLSFLKNRTSVSDASSEFVHKTKDVHNSINKSTADIHPSRFIKKELIEDEIVSESQAISSKGLVLNSNTFNSCYPHTTSEPPNFNLESIKIKTEPPDNEYSESISSTNPPTQGVTHSSSSLSYSTVDLNIKSAKNNTCKNRGFDNFMQKDVNIPNVTLNQYQNSKSQYINRVNLNDNLSHDLGVSNNEEFNERVSCDSISSNNHSKNLDFQNTNVKTSDLQSVHGLNQAMDGVLNIHNDKNITSKTVKSKKKNKLNAQFIVKKSVPENSEDNVIHSDFKEINENEVTSDDNASSNGVDGGTDCSINSLKIGIKRKKVKKKSLKVDENKSRTLLDENEPLTLFIKRKKMNSGDTDTPDSFLCTNVASKPLQSESYTCSSVNSSVELNKNSNVLESQKDVDSSSQKKKKQSKKKQNKAQRSISTGESNESEPRFVPSLKIPIKPKGSNFNSDVYIDKRFDASSNKFNTNVSETSSVCSSEATVIKQGDYVAYMDFNEEFTEDHAVSIKNENDLLDNTNRQFSGLIPAIKNIKKEKDSPVHSEDYSNISYENQLSTPLSQDTQFEESMSISSQTSNISSNIGDITGKSINRTLELKAQVVSKKKKKRARSNGWYKKKKSKAKDSSQSFEESFQSQESPVKVNAQKKRSKGNVNSQTFKETLQEPVSKVNVHDHLVTASKVPIVVIRNLLPKKFMLNEENKVNDNLYSQQKPINSSPKNKKKKGKTSRKRKKSSPQSKTNVSIGEVLLNETALESDKSADNDNTKTIQNYSTKCSEEPISKIPSEEECPVYNICKPANEKTVQPIEHNISADEQMNMGEMSSVTKEVPNCSSIITNKDAEFIPSLNVEEFAQDIATFEAILLNGKSNSTSEKIQNFNEENLKECNSKSGNITTKEIESLSQTLSKEIHKNKCLSDGLMHTHGASKPLNTEFSEVSSRAIFDQPFSSIQVKKEMDDSANINSLNQNSLTLFNKKSANEGETVTSSTSLGLLFIKKEKNPEEIPIYKSSATLYTDHRKDNLTSVESVTLSSNSPSLFQNSKLVDINTVGLEIKKEVSDAAKLGSNSNYVIKDQNDLIKKVCSSNLETINTNGNFIHSTAVQSGLFVSSSQNSSNLNEEEIQVLPVEQKSEVLCVDLTDDFPASAEETLNGTLQFNAVKNVASHLIEPEETIKPQSISSKPSSPITSDVGIALNESFSLPKSNELSSQLESFKENILTKDFINKTSVDNKDIIKPTKTSPILNKYANEYFTHPFPPSVVFYNKKLRNRDYIYTRIDSKSLNLTIDEVESRLKCSNGASQFGKKLGDIVKLENYPVSFNEVECYHRILGVAPSHKLLSKCFVSPDKKYRTKIKSDFEDSFTLCQPRNVQDQYEVVLKDINALIQGIAETKMECTNSAKINSPFFERNCPSTDTRDSFDSHISNLSDRSFIPTQNKDICNPKNDNKDICNPKNDLPVNETDTFSISKDANSSDQNSVLSSTATDLQSLPKSDISTIDFSSIKCSDLQFIKSLNFNETCVENNSVANLTLPDKQVVECSISNNVENQPYIETSTASFSSFIELRNDEDIQKLSTDQNVQVESVKKSDINTSKEFQSSVDINDKIQGSLDVAELRKILEVASSLDIGPYDNNAWKSKATFEYNHTQSTPVEANSDYSASENVESYSSLPSNVCQLNSSTKHTEKDNSDDDYVENEPVYNESDAEDENTHSITAEESEKSVEVPPYKSKWEKIMERKAQEQMQKEKKINEHLLKDCFPVSAAIKTQNKKNSSFDKGVSKPNVKEAGNQSKEDYTKIKNKTEELVADKSSKEKNCKQKLNKHMEKQNKNLVKDAKKKEKVKSDVGKREAKEKSLKKTDGTEDSSNLFVPDKLVKSPNKKKVNITNNKSEANEKSKRSFGRVTNRGTFLTETKLPEMKRIPKKKTPEINKKRSNIRPEEFHSLIKSPDINIGPSVNSKYKNANKSLDSRKNSEFYKSPLTDNTSTSSHFIRTKKMRDRQFPYMNPQFSNRANNQNKKNLLNIPLQPHAEYGESMCGRTIPLLNTPTSIAQHPNNESILNKNIPLLNTALPILSHPSDEDMLPRKIPVLNTQRSVPSFRLNEQCVTGSQIPVLINKTSSTSSELPTNSFQSGLDSSNVSFLQQIISTLKPPVPEVQNRLPVPDPLSDTTWDNNQLNSSCGINKTVKQTKAQSNLPASFGNILLPETLDPRKAARMNSVPSVPVVNQLNTSFNSSVKTSPPFATSINYSEQVLSQTTRKATCLVPQHLKSLVGHETIETQNVRLLMLEWSVDWLMQQQQFKDPPPISNALKKVVSSYDSFEDYYNTYFPLLLLDTWHRIYVSWTHLNQTSPYSCQINSYSVKSHYVSVECHTVFNTSTHPKGVFPDEGSILMVKYSTKSNEYTIKILGYVTHVKTKRYNPVTDSKLLSNLRIPKDVKPEFLQVLTLTFMGAYNSEDIDKREPISIHVLCNVKPTLKQNDALLFINKSPLQRSILNPVADGLRSLTLTSRNAPLEQVNECVRDITKGILSPHPLPLLTVVRAKPESDRLNIIPLLIEKMKTAYKTKVLLCVRTVRALGDIAANICLNRSLKLVIVNKRCDTNPQFQKYLLDELASAEIKKTEEDKPGEKVHIKNEVFIKTKKQILSDCDVVLSLVRNSHDEFMGETLAEKDCIAQMCCIVDEANLCTEPETLIPILHGISKLILIGDPDYSAKVLSKTAASYDYSQSFFQRAYDLDLLED